MRNPQSSPPPRKALARWLAQINYNSVRNIEAVFPDVMQSDRARPLRGFKIADDLVLTRKRTFYKIAGPNATPMSVQDVSANYSLDALRSSYRSATELWKNTHRRKAS